VSQLSGGFWGKEFFEELLRPFFSLLRRASVQIPGLSASPTTEKQSEAAEPRLRSIVSLRMSSSAEQTRQFDFI